MFRAFHHRAYAAVLLDAGMDALLGFLAVLIAAWTISAVPMSEFGQTLSNPSVMLAASGFAVCMAMLQSFLGLYRQAGLSFASQLARLLVAMSIGGYLTYLVLKEVGFDGHPSRLVGYSVANLIFAILVVRGTIVLVRAAQGSSRVLIVGTGPEAVSVANDLRRSSRVSGEVIGFYPTPAVAPDQNIDGKLLLDARVPLERLARELEIDSIIVATREQRGGAMPMDQLVICRSMGIPVMDLAGFYERTHAEVPLDSLKASWLVYGPGFVQGRVRQALKRGFDIVTSSILLVLALPVMIIAAVAIKLDSRGPLIYRQERVGLGGRSFMCLKFRSMCTDAERDGVARWATKNDARVTRVGRIIRKARIDELPQLFSVLKGEMSIVGPRPERPSFVKELQSKVAFYDLRHTVKPGVTGWAQVRYCYGASVEDARRKHQFDLYYIKNNSLLLDIVILIETVSVVLFGEGQ
ncbi:MAG TPA: TIGR03013 family PEP-CTERM/XrtA system glycosyltransferase [Piscinibacter sp.]|nr:TIGR03013 family PEP-CTERM/XrtA system glycosyltransferase [Piscinibacter sp.]